MNTDFFEDDDVFVDDENDKNARNNLNRLNSLICEAWALIDGKILPQFVQADEAYNAIELAQLIIQHEILGEDEEEEKWQS